MRTTEGDRIFTIIRGHIGRDQAISAREIAVQMGWRESREREVRRIISTESALWPDYVCGREGFYIPESDAEIIADYGWVSYLVLASKERQSAKKRILARLGLIRLTDPALRKEAA